MVYEEHERDAEWQATYQRCVDAFLRHARSLHPHDPLAYDTAPNEHWIHAVAEAEADRDLARRIEHVEQVELVQIRDEAQADLWRSWHGDEEDEDVHTFADGLTNAQKRFVDELVKDDRYT